MLSRDFLIVGQGIAGSCLSMQLLDLQRLVTVVDREEKVTSSKIAAGLINPVTGRRFVKSWNIDDLLPFATSFYQKYERLAKEEFIQTVSIYKKIPSTKEENEWESRLADPSYSQYLDEISTLTGHPFRSRVQWGRIHKGMRVFVPEFLEYCTGRIRKEGILLGQTFHYADLEITDDGFVYFGVLYRNVIFCEGFHGQSNPFFEGLPFNLSKGEVVTLREPKLKLNKVLNYGKIIVPLKDDNYWLGSNYEWDTIDQETTDIEAEQLVKSCKEVLDIEGTVIQHQAAVRPTVRDRRPMIGQHSKYKGMYIFNGMGTKGTSLAPSLASGLLDYIFNKVPLPQEVNIARFDR